jgi:hypothetical protein
MYHLSGERSLCDNSIPPLPSHRLVVCWAADAKTFWLSRRVAVVTPKAIYCVLLFGLKLASVFIKLNCVHGSMHSHSVSPWAKLFSGSAWPPQLASYVTVSYCQEKQNSIYVLFDYKIPCLNFHCITGHGGRSVRRQASDPPWVSCHIGETIADHLPLRELEKLTGIAPHQNSQTICNCGFSIVGCFYAQHCDSSVTFDWPSVGLH